MKISELIVRINSLNDEEVDSSDAVAWMNDCQNDLGNSIGATFPTLSTTDTDVEPPISEEWQEIYVIYAVAKAKEKDSSIREADRYYSQFLDKKKSFVSGYVVPTAYKKTTAPLSDKGMILHNPYGWSW